MNHPDLIDLKTAHPGDVISTIKGPRELGSLVVYIEESDIPCGKSITTSYFEVEKGTCPALLFLVRRDVEIRVKPELVAQGHTKL